MLHELYHFMLKQNSIPEMRDRAADAVDPISQEGPVILKLEYNPNLEFDGHR